MITGGGFVLPAIFPGIARTSPEAKKIFKLFDKRADKFDLLDDAVNKAAQDVSPMAPQAIKNIKFQSLSDEIIVLEKEVKRLDNPWGHKIPLKEVKKQLKKAKKELAKKKKQLEKESPFLEGSVGAAQVVKTFTEDEWLEMEKIAKTGLGWFGEKGMHGHQYSEH